MGTKTRKGKSEGGEKREGISIFIPFYQEMGLHMRYMLLPSPQNHKELTKSYIFPSKNQLTLHLHLKYWWLKLLRRRPAVCDGSEDQKEIQEAIDSNPDVIVLGGGEFNMTSEVKIGLTKNE